MPICATPEPIRRTARDGRADDRSRRVTIRQDTILIERQVAGVRMHVAVPVAAYAALVLARRAAPAADYAVVLSHRDPELCIEIEAGADLVALSERLPGWSRFFDKPAVPVPGSAADRALPPARRRMAADRRPTRLARRSPERLSVVATVFRHEDEIIAYD